MKKNILFCIESMQSGGAEKVLIDILNNINYKLFNVDLIVFDEFGEYMKYINKNVNLIILNSKKYIFIKRYFHRRILKWFPKKIYKYYVKKIYDVEIAFLEGPATKFISNSINYNSKKIAWVHTDLTTNHWTEYIFKNNDDEKRCYKKFDNIVFVSKYSQNAFNSMFNIYDKSKQKVIYNPIFVQDIKSKSNEFIVKYEKKTIVAIGRLVKEKGFDRLIKAHKELIKEFDHKLVILGEGKQELELLKLIHELNVEETVELKGFKKNPYPYIKSADLLVSSSISEGYSLVIAEALVLGTPVLSTDTIGPREILDNGKYGYICENSIAGLKNAIHEIFTANNIISNEKNELIFNNTIKKIEKLILE